MWCKHCRQDVPGLASPSERQIACARCGEPVGDSTAAENVERDGLPGEDDALDEPAYDPWLTNEKLRHADRVIKLLRLPGGDLETVLRCDPPQLADAARAREPVERAGRHSRRYTVAGAWAAFAAGVAALSCGAMLTTWSMIGARPELWNLGLPMIALGQLALMAGVALHLVSRSAAEKAAANAPEPRPSAMSFRDFSDLWSQSHRETV